MRYTIKEILPGSIKVEFEDKSWAIVPISPDSTMEDVDHAVSQYDPDFLLKPGSSMNPEILVGLERTSKQNDTTSKDTNPAAKNNQLPVPAQIQTINTQFGIAELAEYFASKGDNRLKNALYNKIEAYVTHDNFSIDVLVSNYQSVPVHYPIAPNIDPELDNSWEDIVKQAEEELNAGKS